MNPGFWLSAVFLLSNVGIPEAADQCCEGEYSVSGMFLKGHVFKTVETTLHQTLNVTWKANNISDAKAAMSLLMNIFAS